MKKIRSGEKTDAAGTAQRSSSVNLKAQPQWVQSLGQVIHRLVRQLVHKAGIPTLSVVDIEENVLLDVLSLVNEGRLKPEEADVVKQILHPLIQNEIIKHANEQERLSGHVREKTLLVRETTWLYLETGDDLTPRYLEHGVVPYLNALETLQHVIDNLLGEPHENVLIKSLTRESPLSINLEGLSDALDAIKEELIPWRKKHAQKIAELRQHEAAADIKKKESEAMEIRARSTKSRAEAEKVKAEVLKLREEARRLEIENESLRFDFQGKKLRLALELVGNIQPDLPPEQRLVYATRMLASLETLAMSNLEPKLLAE